MIKVSKSAMRLHLVTICDDVDTNFSIYQYCNNIYIAHHLCTKTKNVAHYNYFKFYLTIDVLHFGVPKNISTSAI